MKTLVICVLAFSGCAQFIHASNQQTYQAAAEAQALAREAAMYDACRALILDVDRAAADPARAGACVNTMAAIDRDRAARRQAIVDAQETHARVFRDIAHAYQSRPTATTTCHSDYAGGLTCTTEGP